MNSLARSLVTRSYALHFARRVASAAAVAGSLALAACGGGGRGIGGDGGAGSARDLWVMTQNVYYGTEFDPVIEAVSLGDPEAIVGAVTTAWAEIRANDFAARADAIANGIALHRPDFVGLQEAALYRVQVPSDAFTDTPTPALTVALDYAQMVIDALARRGLAYELVVSVESLDVELPGLTDDGTELQDIRITDRDALLARRDLAVDGIALGNPQSGLFANAVVLESGIAIPSGWVSIDANVAGRLVRIVSTHLASGVEDVQRAQAVELLAGPLAGADAAVLVGDLNSDALGGVGPDGTATYADLVSAGLSDAWSEAHPTEAGATWGRSGDLASDDPTLTERIDVALSKGALDVLEAERLGANLADRVHGLWPSDHAGVVARFAIR